MQCRESHTREEERRPWPGRLRGRMPYAVLCPQALRLHAAARREWLPMDLLVDAACPPSTATWPGKACRKAFHCEKVLPRMTTAQSELATENCGAVFLNKGLMGGGIEAILVHLTRPRGNSNYPHNPYGVSISRCRHPGAERPELPRFAKAVK
jgi:hypothetical protein